MHLSGQHSLHPQLKIRETRQTQHHNSAKYHVDYCNSELQLRLTTPRTLSVLVACPTGNPLCPSFSTSFLRAFPQEESPMVAKLVEDMLRPQSLPQGWTAKFDEAKGRR